MNRLLKLTDRARALTFDMPEATAAARVDLTNHNLNPSGIVAGGQTVTLILTYADGKTFVPEDLWDALITKFGAGKVTSNRDTQARNHYQWTINP